MSVSNFVWCETFKSDKCAKKEEEIRKQIVFHSTVCGFFLVWERFTLHLLMAWWTVLTNSVFWQCSQAHANSAGPPEGLKITSFQTCHTDFSWSSELFHIMNCISGDIKSLYSTICRHSVWQMNGETLPMFISEKH